MPSATSSPRKSAPSTRLLSAPDGPAMAPVVRRLAHSTAVAISEVSCHYGPHDRRFEERHAAVSLAVVLEGSFQYRTGTGSAMLYPGALLLGNAQACYECGHSHSTGDRCLAVQFDPDCFHELATSVSGDGHFAFRLPMLPALRELTAPLQGLLAQLQQREPLGAEVAALQLGEMAVGVLTGRSLDVAAPKAREQRRIDAVLRHVDANAHEAIDLEQLAAMASMSKYHFLRCFRRWLGITPHQWLLTRRLHRAAAALRGTTLAVSELALESGFSDLSRFHALFRSVFGLSPLAYRRQFLHRAG